MKGGLIFLLVCFFAMTCFTQSNAYLAEQYNGSEKSSLENSTINALVHKPTFSDVTDSNELPGRRLSDNENDRRKYSVLGVMLKPNPVKNILVVENTNEQESNLALFDLTGKQIAQYSVAGGDEWRYEVSALENGIYFLSITVSKQQGLLKVFKI